MAKNKSDPYCDVFIKNNKTAEPEYIGSTERQGRKNDVIWAELIPFDYIIGNSILVFKIMDFDRGKKDDYLGECEQKAGDIARAGNPVVCSLTEQTEREDTAVLVIVANEMPGLHGKFIEMHFSAKNLPFQIPSLSPYLRFIHIHNDPKKNEMIKTEVVKTKPYKWSRFPIWKPILISVSSFGHNHSDIIRIDCYDSEIGSDHLIGSCLTTIAKISIGAQGFPLLNDKQKKIGELILTELNIISFWDYYNDGYTVQILFFVDLTKSNTHKKLLHHERNEEKTPYHVAFEAIGHASEQLNPKTKYQLYGKLN